MKKALITGITGQDGSYLAELLLSKGYEVFGSDVTVMASPLSSQNVFGTTNRTTQAPLTTWSVDRNLRFDFDQPTTTVSLLAIGFLLSSTKIFCARCADFLTVSAP